MTTIEKEMFDFEGEIREVAFYLNMVEQEYALAEVNGEWEYMESLEDTLFRLYDNLCDLEKGIIPKDYIEDNIVKVDGPSVSFDIDDEFPF